MCVCVRNDFKGSRTKTVDRKGRKHLIRARWRGLIVKKEKKRKQLNEQLNRNVSPFCAQRVCLRCLWLILLMTDEGQNGCSYAALSRSTLRVINVHSIIWTLSKCAATNCN